MSADKKHNLQNAREHLDSLQEDVVKARKCENINDPIDTYFIDYVAMMFSKIFVKLGVIPNVITVMSMLSGVLGGVIFALDISLGWDIAAVVLSFLSVLFDSCDGQVARLTRRFSRLGRMLDGMSDATVYLSLYIACVCRLWGRSPFASSVWWHVFLVVLVPVTMLFYVAQNQLTDYYKNLHMYMIDNSGGNELSRTKYIKRDIENAPRGSFERFSLKNYYIYTLAQERRAPRCQEMLDTIEIKGKSDEAREAFYASSRRMVKLTNLVAYYPRTIVLLACMLLHVEYVGILFVFVVLEPIRLILLSRYEKLCASVKALLQ